MDFDTDEDSDYVREAKDIGNLPSCASQRESIYAPREDAGFILKRPDEKSRAKSTLPPVENMKGTSGDEDYSLVGDFTEYSSDDSCWSPWEEDFEEDIDSLSFGSALEGLRSQCAWTLFSKFQQCQNPVVGETQDVDKSPTHGSRSASTSMDNACSTSPATPQHHNKRIKDNEPHEDDEKDGSQKRLRRSRRLDMTDDRLLACPYCKHDPHRYRSCYGKVLKEISRLKLDEDICRLLNSC
jgi:hypothetical protein